jgi:putative transposase
MGSHNREKARITFAKAKEKETDQRHDFLHKISRDLVDRHGIIALESLDIKQLIQLSPCPDDINRSAGGGA